MWTQQLPQCLRLGLVTLDHPRDDQPTQRHHVGITHLSNEGGEEGTGGGSRNYRPAGTTGGDIGNRPE